MGESMISFDVISLFAVHAAFFTALWVLAALSKIFGAAKKKKPVYRLFFHSGILLAAALGVGVVGFDVPEFRAYALALDVAGLLLGAAVTYFYWDWLPRELEKR